MDRIVEGYRFTSDEDAKLAKEELEKVNYISQKLSADDPKAVLLVYNKSIQSALFTTPVGIDFLKSMQNYLKKNPAINNEDILDIPMQISYSDALIIRQNKRYDSLNVKEKNYKSQYKFSVAFNIILVIMVIAMFFIALKAGNANILNYKTAILNEYADWEQSLKERENVIRQKERELNIGSEDIEKQSGEIDFSIEE